MPGDLPNLTPEEATLVGVLLVSDAPLHDVALECGISLLEAVRILDQPQCQAHMNAARDVARRRFEAKAADAAAQALHALREMADAPGTDHPAAVERRRAATTIIRAATAHHRRPVRRRPHRPPTCSDAHQPHRRPASPTTPARPHADAAEPERPTAPAREPVNAAEPASPSPVHRPALVPHEVAHPSLRTAVFKPP